jgi:hypothetical protein
MSPVLALARNAQGRQQGAQMRPIASRLPANPRLGLADVDGRVRVVQVSAENQAA